nr:hypothetical protein [Streptomyces sp. NEAU-383]
MVRHAAVLSPTATVTLPVDDAALVLSVADAHPLKPKPPPAAHSVGGRGLFMVNALVREVHGRAEVLSNTGTGGKRIVIHLPSTPKTCHPAAPPGPDDRRPHSASCTRAWLNVSGSPVWPRERGRLLAGDRSRSRA